MNIKNALLPLLPLAALCACHSPVPVVAKDGKVSLRCTLSSAGIAAETKTLSCSQGLCGLPPALEEALVGKAHGDKFKVKLPAEKSFPYVKEYVREVPVALLPKDGKPAVGEKIEASTQDGKKIVCVIKEVGRKQIQVDCNNPFAGKPLDCDIEIITAGK